MKENVKLTDSYELELFPEICINFFILSSNDIFNYRSELKNLIPNEYILFYLLKIIEKDLYTINRSQTIQCLKVIKRIIKNFSDNYNHKFLPETVRSLFFLFQKFVLCKNKEIRNCVNVYIKGQILDSPEINWMIENYHTSDEITNRLLRYPYKNKKIYEWALKILSQNLLEDRLPEIIGILIDKDIPKFIQATSSQIIRAIYHARISDRIKRKLLRERFCVDDFENLIIAARSLNYMDVCLNLIKFMRENNNFV